MSALKNFAAIPERAAGDQSLTVRELRVLAAICRAVRRDTGIAVISQNAIAKRANMARQKISTVTASLERKGYLRRVEAKTRKNGWRPVAQYAIVYEPEGVQPDTHGSDRPATTDGNSRSATTNNDMDQAPPAVTRINDVTQQDQKKEIQRTPEDPTDTWRRYRESMLKEFNERFGDLVDERFRSRYDQ